MREEQRGNKRKEKTKKEKKRREKLIFSTSLRESEISCCTSMDGRKRAREGRG